MKVYVSLAHEQLRGDMMRMAYRSREANVITNLDQAFNLTVQLNAFERVTVQFQT